MPYAEIGIGQASTFAKPGYYNTFLKEQPGAGLFASIGLGKQLDDLKVTTSIGLQRFEYSVHVYSAKTYYEGQTASYLTGHLSYESPLFDSSRWQHSKLTTQFVYGNFALGVEKSYGQNLAFGLIVRNNFLIDYYDDEELQHWTPSDSVLGWPSYDYHIDYSGPIGRSVRGVRRYQATGELRAAYRVRRQHVKADLGLNAMLSINSITSKKPTTTYLRHIGLFARIYFLPKKF